MLDLEVQFGDHSVYDENVWNYTVMRYRADIDGLRAVAVIPVVLFHARAPWFQGGFVGVDVFFVISGYLITTVIVAELDNKAFSLLSFYQRRIRRIFPALVVVLAFCLVAGFALLTPTDYQRLGQSTDAAALFVSNIFFGNRRATLTSPLPKSHFSTPGLWQSRNNTTYFIL